MKHNKILIILIVVIVALILAAGGFVLAYMTTDILKTDEQLFYKYISLVGKDITQLNSQDLANYEKKTQTTPYESNGTLTVNVTAPEDIAEEMNLDIVNDMNISFTGKTDKANKITEQSISINYSDEVSLPILYKITGDIFGITSEKIINNAAIIGIKNENLPELAQKLGIEGEIPDDLTSIVPSITEEQLTNELAKLKQIILDNLKADNFSKVDEKTFVLTLSEKQSATIILQLLEEIKNSGMLSESITEAINESTEDIQIEQLSDDQFLKIAVSKDKKAIISIDEEIIAILTSANGAITIQMPNDENSPIIAIQKTKNENNLSYKISYMEGYNEVSFIATYSGLQTQTANENYILTLSIEASDNEETPDMTNAQDEKIQYQYSFNTSKTFVNAVQVEELNSDNAYILNDKQAETLQILMQQIVQQIIKVNEEQMQQLGVEVNPLIYATPLGTLYYSIYSSADNVVSNSSTQIEELAKQSFNSMFINFEGIQKGSIAKSLISKVVTNNQDNSDHIVSVNGYTDESSLQNLISQLNVSANYNIQMNYGEQGENAGYITSITIAAQ